MDIFTFTICLFLIIVFTTMGSIFADGKTRLLATGIPVIGILLYLIMSIGSLEKTTSSIKHSKKNVLIEQKNK